MQVPVGSLRHKLWQFSFLFDVKPPRHTTKRRFWLRTVFLPIPVAILLVLSIVLSALLALAGNLMTILSGTGIFVMWDDGSVYVDQFDKISIGDYEIPSQLVAALVWICVGLGLLWYHYPDGFMMYGLITVRVAVVTATIGTASFWVVGRADKTEDDDSDRILDLMVSAAKEFEPIPEEIVIFVDPPARIEEMPGA